MKLEVLHVAATAGADAPPLLFVHGSYCAASIWSDPFMPHFAGLGFTCHALSLRGHGGSEGTVEWASLADYIADVVQVLTELERPPVLVGHSMGGLIVQHVAAAGHAIAGLVMLASTPPSGLGSSSLHMMAHAPDVLFQLGLLQSLGPRAVSIEVMQRALLAPGSDIEAVAWMVPMLQKESTRVAAELLMPPRPWPPSGRRIPALVVGGDGDRFLPVSAFAETAEHWGAELHVLPGAPHALMVDSQHWRACADLLADWLQRNGDDAL